MEVLMGVSEILASVDREIALLKQVRALLTGSATVAKACCGSHGPHRSACNQAAAQEEEKAFS
jgi:hypothetical protein